MIKRWVGILFMMATMLSLMNGFAVGAARVTVTDVMKAREYTDSTISTESLPYRLYIPESYSPDHSYYLLLHLHGAGECGEDNLKQIANGDMTRLIYRILNDEALREQFIIVAPQCPQDKRWVEKEWGAGTYSVDSTPQSIPSQQVMSLLQKEITVKYNVDAERIYVTGLSMGGFATWDLICRYPEYFAAAIPVCGGADASYADKIKHIPIWTFHSSNDQIVDPTGTYDMVTALRKLGADITYTKTDEGTKNDAMGHSAWAPAYREEELLSWLLSKTKSSSTSDASDTALNTSVSVSDQNQTTSSDNTTGDTASDSGKSSIAVWITAGTALALAAVGILLLAKRKKNS